MQLVLPSFGKLLGWSIYNYQESIFDSCNLPGTGTWTEPLGLAASVQHKNKLFIQDKFHSHRLSILVNLCFCSLQVFGK